MNKDQKRGLKRSLTAFDTFFNTDRKDNCRAHFRHALAFFVTNVPTHKDGLSKAASISLHQIANAENGLRTGAKDAQRRAAARYVCQVATQEGLEVPPSLIQKVAQPAHALVA